MTEKDLDVAIEKCERIMEMDTRTMQNPVSENGWIFERVYDLLQYLRQFQYATDTNVGGNLKYDEWCTDCKEYDQERHSCPRWNRVIRQTVEDVKAAQLGCEDAVYRKAVQMLLAYFVPEERYAEAVDGLRRLPSAQPNLSEAYSKAVFTWLMDYQIRAAELKGRYTPYEVLSWVVNDWRKEHERSD